MTNHRVNKLKAYLKKSNIEAMLIACPANVRYLSGFTSAESWLLISPKQNVFISDFRYKLQAQQEIDSSYQIEMVTTSVYALLAELSKKLKISSLCFEPDHITYNQYCRIKAALPPETQIISSQNFVEQLRMLKSPEEIALIRKAVKIVKKSLNQLKPLIKSGISERALKTKLELLLLANGSTQPAFDTIVASGPNAAMPHAVTTDRKIKNNEPIIIDVGATVEGYKSDLTRTFFSGKISEYIEYYKLVATAQDRAIKLIRPQVKIEKIDAAARQVLKAADLDKYFGHSLGHGVGLEVHEAPNISGKNSMRLKRSMVFTVEPGIYIPGSGGIRIEDMVLVTDKGCEIL
ncbi:MAG: Xaa-Pro peptidase family protein [Candidatus Omnitrophica bacterium]|nr:Xaa-Pro peptidase family protein [Candidatus Omnitrophota bacterium]